jgi:hypothetical protein
MYYLDVLSRCLLVTPFFWCDKNAYMMSTQTQLAQDLTLSLVLFFCFYFSGGKKVSFQPEFGKHLCLFVMNLHVLWALDSVIHHFPCRMQKENQKRHGAP